MFRAFSHVLMFVPSVPAAAGWYSSLLGVPAEFLEESYARIAVGGIELCFHPADAKVPAGRAGQVGYWRVESLAEARQRFETMGATLYRGPLEIEDGQGICQFADPFGNLVGVIGPFDL